MRRPHAVRTVRIFVTVQQVQAAYGRRDRLTWLISSALLEARIVLVELPKIIVRLFGVAAVGLPVELAGRIFTLQSIIERIRIESTGIELIGIKLIAIEQIKFVRIAIVSVAGRERVDKGE